MLVWRQTLAAIGSQAGDCSSLFVSVCQILYTSLYLPDDAMVTAPLALGLSLLVCLCASSTAPS